MNRSDITYPRLLRRLRRAVRFTTPLAARIAAPRLAPLASIDSST
jgi:hypothetical protein